mmetsp:Transcript_14708/g.31952  ORF Transcript_14708/g.31952 Transcript_14708/m.31952 type:complete len:713 (+) Transcript_14708:123-2261(+)|eukprot:CAMPEP_0172315754 /NCGR_PEP_ID=MMETSP1058-20130122/26182_1 /TAXON_ID=83371 /ORGANISM="Detonula confervacea, Strain CCMP 353" /LENGTH=712 /DNA_ID=CAMNT_0013029909 /DNA_START=40 /DNA_END=2178 /DNA_ORIENTATION=+
MAPSQANDRDSPSCPCCSNPWQAATADFFAKLCVECEEKPTTEKNVGTGLSRDNMDFNVHPRDNFFLYSNGNWMKNNPIPSGYPSWNSFMSLRLKSQEDCKTILTELEEKLKKGEHVTDEEKKVALFYKAAMDEEAIESAGITPMLPLLELCAETANCKDDKVAFAKCLGKMAFKYAVTPFFSIGAGPDNKNTEHSIAQVAQGGIRLLDRDYYFDEDKEEQRVAYKKTMALLLTLLEDPSATDPSDEAVATAEKVYELEKTLAEAHMTKTENRDPHDTYNKMTMEELNQNGNGAFDFGSYAEAITGKTLPEIGDINLRNVQALKKVAEVAPTTDTNTLHAYFRWMAVASCAPYLSSPFVNAHFEFYEKTLAGTQEIKPRWKRAMEFTENALGEALGKLYCAKFFDETSKGRALKIVEQVRQALEDRLKEVEWMKSEETRANALKKMSTFGVKIGYPDKWLDYSPLIIDESDSFLSMVLRAREFDSTEEIKEINAPTDKSKWFMTPQTINAYYHPNLNEIVFPAAILQYPFFDKDADDAVNFGSMGCVIGHEMTHGFDDKGRKFDHKGNMVDWWTEEDGKEYEKRVEVMVEQANNFEVHGQSVKGKLTSGENIADLGGLRLAFRALTNAKNYDPGLLIDGFSPVQRFYLSWAQCWRQNITKERALQLLTIDPHGPNDMRCNGPLSNISEFHEAFSVTATDPMYKEAEARVDIW